MNRVLVDSGIGYLGNIPSEWNIFRIKNAFNCGKNIVNDNWSNTQLLSLTTSGVKEKDIDNPNGKLPDSFDGYQYVEENNIIMCLFDLDCSAVFSGISKYNGMISPAYKVLECKEIMNPDYAGYYFNYISFDRKYMHYSKNIRYTLNYDEFSSLPMLIPPLEEQIKISNYLDNKVSLIDKTIENNKKEIELLEEYKVSFIDKEIFFEKTNNIKLKYLVKVRNEKGISKKSNEFISLENIESRTGNHIITETDYSNCSGKIFKKGDLLINKLRPYLAKSYLAEFDGVCTGEIEVISGFWGNIDYLKYYTLSSKYIDLVNSSTYGTKMPRANWNFIKNMLIPNISIEKQTNVVNNINNINDKINQVIQYRKQIIEKLEEYKKSLIYEAVTGKIEV